MTDKITIELETLPPCPFCGGAPSKPTKDGGSDERVGYNFKMRIVCTSCGASIQRESVRDKNGWCNDTGQALASTIAAWNRRTALAAQPAEPVAWVDAVALVQLAETGFCHAELSRLRRRGKAPIYTAPPAPAEVPPGYALVPDYRGYANLGTGQYLLDISADDEPPELIISIASDEEKAGRTVGDLRDNKPGAVIQPERMAVRLRFASEAGLAALEQQLRILRKARFAAAGDKP